MTWIDADALIIYQKRLGPESAFLLPVSSDGREKGMKRRGLLLDRDGVVNVEFGYVGKRENFVFKIGLFPFLREMQDHGYRLAIVTNQSGVAQGLYTEDEYNDLTAWMLEGFRQEGVFVDLVLACFAYEEARLPEYKRQSFWRKPNPGMVLEAAQKLQLDPSRSVMIGDRERDMRAALMAGIGTCLWMTEEKNVSAPDNVTVVSDFGQALERVFQGRVS